MSAILTSLKRKFAEIQIKKKAEPSKEKKAKKAKKKAKKKEKEEEEREEEIEEVTKLYTANDRKRGAVDRSYRPELKKHCDRKTFVGGGAFNRDLARVIHSASFRRLRNKAQLFPPTESDAFRTRLTHSLEVSQIAQGLAREAAKIDGLKGISLELIDMAALAHDIGHPPFGHNGERALNDWMKGAGGFEGNAQNLRVLARLEKKRKPNGLNLTYRALAAVLKKDAEIGTKVYTVKDGVPTESIVEKGYYASERGLVDRIKEHVIGLNAEEVKNVEHAKGASGAKVLRTIECAIMDAADDIAYATYDLEDSLKGGFMSLMDMLACDYKLATEVRDKILKDPEAEALKGIKTETVQSVLRELALEGLDHVKVKTFRPEKLERSDSWLLRQSGQLNETEDARRKTEDEESEIFDAYVAEVYRSAKKLADNSRFRTSFTSSLVNGFMRGVQFQLRDPPCLSEVIWEPKALQRVMVLKHFTFFFVIKTPQIQAWESNGRKVVRGICELLWDDEDGSNLPPDWKSVFKNAKTKLDKVKKAASDAECTVVNKASGLHFWLDGEEEKMKQEKEQEKEKQKGKQKEEDEEDEEGEEGDVEYSRVTMTAAEAVKAANSQLKRVICDFVAGMTDTYAVEFYGRLTSLQPTTIFKKL